MAPRLLLILVCLLAGRAATAGGGSPCAWPRIAEKALAEQLVVSILPFGDQERVTKRQVKDATEVTESLLKDHGGHYNRLTRFERARLETALQLELEEGLLPQTALDKEGHLYRILVLP